MTNIQNILLAIVLLPLVSSLIVGLGGRRLGRTVSHNIAILGVFVSFILSAYILFIYISNNLSPVEISLYDWANSDSIKFEAGFLLDSLSSSMMVVVTFVSLMVHIYTIGYMEHDEDYDHSNPYYQRFFSYLCLFTFAMLALVMSNNFLQLFFGWEAVGLVSYLLIGFYMKRESAITANLKAFLVNRVGDFGFLIGIAFILVYFNTLNYHEFFSALETKKLLTVDLLGLTNVNLLEAITICLFIGAMAKSAQMPLHVWLPESMEGPTPISALIHAATMVTAGIFMVVRLSPAFELSPGTLVFILFIGSSTAFFMGLVGLVQNDIKRVVAYSTLSQLGYMVAALGVSAYVVGYFHVVTHAFFKALLFLGAGSVIVAMHHKQDIREMGGLYKYMPITYATMLIGNLALIGFPSFSGFYSKEIIILAVGESNNVSWVMEYAFLLLNMGVFVTAFYSFRMFFMVFHSKESEYVKNHNIKESPLVITVPLILLAIPSVLLGALTVDYFVFGDFLTDSIKVFAYNNVIGYIDENIYKGALDMIAHSFVTTPFYLAIGGVVVAWLFYVIFPKILHKIPNKLLLGMSFPLTHAYGFDAFNNLFFVNSFKRIGNFFYKFIDTIVIDTLIVNGVAKSIAYTSATIKKLHTGYLFHYVLIFVLSILGLIIFMLYKV